MTRELFVAIVVGTSVPALIIWLYLYWRETDLARRVTTIANPTDLDHLKGVVKEQMIGVLFLVPLGFAPFLMVPVAMVLDVPLSLFDKAFYALYAAFFSFSTPKVKALEEQLRSLPTSTEWLQSEYQRVVHTWKKRAFPDW